MNNKITKEELRVKFYSFLDKNPKLVVKGIHPIFDFFWSELHPEGEKWSECNDCFDGDHCCGKVEGCECSCGWPRKLTVKSEDTADVYLFKPEKKPLTPEEIETLKRLVDKNNKLEKKLPEKLKGREVEGGNFSMCASEWDMHQKINEILAYLEQNK